MKPSAKMLGPQLPTIEVDEAAAELEIPIEPEPKPQPPKVLPPIDEFKAPEESFNSADDDFTYTKETKISRSSGRSGKWLWLGILILFLVVAGAGGILAYIELRPSPAKAYAQAKEQLTDISSLNFDYRLSFDLKIDVTDTNDVNTVVVFTGVGKYDKPARNLLVEGEDESLGDTLAYKQTITGETVYLKYDDRDYLVSKNLDTAVITIQDIEGVNLFSSVTNDTRFGYGAEEMLGINNTYRFRIYPSQTVVNTYFISIMNKIIRTLYPLETPVLDLESIETGEVGYRVWIDTVTYQPRKLQIRVPSIKAVTDKGRIELTDLETNLVLLEINPRVIITSPI